MREPTHWIIDDGRVLAEVGGRSPAASCASSSRWVTTRSSLPWRYASVSRSTAAGRDDRSRRARSASRSPSASITLVEVADVPVELGELRVQVHLDEWVRLHPLDQVRQRTAGRRCPRACSGRARGCRPVRPVFSTRCVRKPWSASESAAVMPARPPPMTSADARDRQRVRVSSGCSQPRPADRHAHEVAWPSPSPAPGRRGAPTSTGRGCWSCRRGTGSGRDSRRVSWNSGSCVRGVQEATTTRFSRCSLMMSLMLLLGVVRAGVEVGLGVARRWAASRASRATASHVDDRRDVVPAVADEHADARLLVGDVALPRVLVAVHQRAARRGRAAPSRTPRPRSPAPPSRGCPSAPGTRRRRRCPGGT